MTIADSIPGLEFTIEVGAEPLAEYKYEPTGDAQDRTPTSMVERYVEAPVGGEFAVRALYKHPFSPAMPVYVELMLDGNYIQAPVQEWAGKDGCEGYKYAKCSSIVDNSPTTQNFCFSDLVAEESDQPVTAEAKRKLSSTGQITIYCYYIKNLREARPTEIPRSFLDQDEAVSHEALKASVTAGDSLAYHASLSAPEVVDRLTFDEVQTADNEAFAAFTFYYRNTAALKSLGIIDRPPSPSPEPEPEPKDPEDMSEEELRAELTRRLNKEREHKEQQLRTKREREDSVATLQGDDDGDVVWLRSQPKRQRRSPGEGDEGVDVED